MPLQEVIAELQAVYSEPEPPKLTDPMDMILWENVAYLVDDSRRDQALVALRECVGTTPEQILAASEETLVQIAKVGILPEQRAARLRLIAQLAICEFAGDPQVIRHLPLPSAKKGLMKFPGIGEPGADKILLFSRSYPVLALDSNGLRVLLRLGFGNEATNYAASYRSVQDAVQEQLEQDYPWLIRAHQLLRRHGQELCRRSQPQCEACPLTSGCLYYQEQVAT